MRSAFFLFVLSVVLLGCTSTPPPGPISQVNSETQVVLQSETDNHEVIQEFDLNNCDGKADATRTEHRSSSIDVTISTELAATIGASAQVISAEVQAAVGTALRIGGDRGTSIELKAPPNTHMFFQLAWVGKSRIGVVQNVSGSNIPIAFQSFTPDNVRIKSQYDIGCRSTPAPLELSDTPFEQTSDQSPDNSVISPTSTATATSIPPTATNTPEPVTNVYQVWAVEEGGVRVNINEPGVYRVSYLGDAYSPWPNEQYEGYRGWTTIVRIYINRPVEWGQTDYGLVGPINHDSYLSAGGYYMDKNQAIAAARGDSRTFRLRTGDYLTLVTLDEKDRYSDNQGKVEIGITYLGQ